MDKLSDDLNYLLKFRIAYDRQINCSTSSVSEPVATTTMTRVVSSRLRTRDLLPLVVKESPPAQ
eukprot:3356299-Heterocapsa_arctica.AAC.1